MSSEYSAQGKFNVSRDLKVKQQAQKAKQAIQNLLRKPVGIQAEAKLKAVPKDSLVAGSAVKTYRDKYFEEIEKAKPRDRPASSFSKRPVEANSMGIKKNEIKESHQPSASRMRRGSPLQQPAIAYSPTSKQVSTAAAKPVVSQSKPIGSIKNSLKKASAMTSSRDFIPLNQVKRDLRTIEEIQLDMKRKKLEEQKSRQQKEAKRRPNVALPQQDGVPDGSSLKTQSSVAGKRNLTTNTLKDPQTKEAGSLKRPPTNSGRTLLAAKSQNQKESQEFYEENYSSIIQNLFGRKGSQYSRRQCQSSNDESDYSSDGMEASAREIEEEEAKSAKIARLEEEREERLLIERKREKEKLKRKTLQ